MLFFPVAVPQPLAIRGPFAALTIDAQRRRVFAAGARSVVMLDADTGKLLATVRLGGARSVALEPLGGHLFVGTRDGRISEVDPDRKTVVRSLDAGGVADVLIYDAATGRLYADGAGRAALATFDMRTFAATAPVALPGRVPASVAPDPVTHELYVEFADRPEIAIVDPARGNVRTAFPTPGLLGNRIVRFDDAFGQIAVTGSNGVLDVYDRAGTRRGRGTVPTGLGGCDVDAGDHVLACSGPAGVTFVQLVRDAPPQIIASVAIPGTVLVALDSKTHGAFVIGSNADGGGASVERFSTSPPSPSPSPSVR
jgi:DNA-binding beta-propeller fold protein YncE